MPGWTPPAKMCAALYNNTVDNNTHSPCRKTELQKNLAIPLLHTKKHWYSCRCQVIVNLINQGLFNAEEGVIIDDEALLNDPDYDENHPLRRPERERQANVVQHCNRQRLDGTWISAEFLMGNFHF